MWRILFLSLIACSHLSTPKSLETALSSIQLEGEGKGRLGINQQSYVFGMDTILKENSDWLLAVNLPLHGEEVMTIRNLKSHVSENDEADTFARRIDYTLQNELKGSLSTDVFIKELRFFLRFILKNKLALNRECRESASGQYLCSLDGEEMKVFFADQKLRLVHDLSHKSIELEAQNLTATGYKRSNFSIKNKSNNQNDLTLELFWD